MTSFSTQQKTLSRERPEQGQNRRYRLRPSSRKSDAKSRAKKKLYQAHYNLQYKKPTTFRNRVQNDEIALDGYSLIDLKKSYQKALLAQNYHEAQMWLDIEAGLL